MLSFFDTLTDLRLDRTKLHFLKDIIGLTICAVLSSCDDWEEIEIYGESKQIFLKQFMWNIKQFHHSISHFAYCKGCC